MYLQALALQTVKAVFVDFNRKDDAILQRMNREIILSADGSHTVAIPEAGITYHSHHGAVQESKHVFIEAGLRHVVNKQLVIDEPLHVFEMGFGTGLNVLLTALEAQQLQTPVHYTAVETTPLSLEEVATLNYPARVGGATIFQKLHKAHWNKEVAIGTYFTLHKQQQHLQNFETSHRFHLVYYDAFAPNAQPELWTEAIFKKLFHLMQPGGVLVTYCSKGAVRRALQAAGFTVEKIPGPPGKREMVRATSPLAPLHLWRGKQ